MLLLGKSVDAGRDLFPGCSLPFEYRLRFCSARKPSLPRQVSPRPLDNPTACPRYAVRQPGFLGHIDSGIYFLALGEGTVRAPLSHGLAISFRFLGGAVRRLAYMVADHAIGLGREWHGNDHVVALCDYLDTSVPSPAESSGRRRSTTTRISTEGNLNRCHFGRKNMIETRETQISHFTRRA